MPLTPTKQASQAVLNMLLKTLHSGFRDVLPTKVYGWTSDLQDTFWAGVAKPFNKQSGLAARGEGT